MQGSIRHHKSIKSVADVKKLAAKADAEIAARAAAIGKVPGAAAAVPEGAVGMKSMICTEVGPSKASRRPSSTPTSKGKGVGANDGIVIDADSAAGRRCALSNVDHDYMLWGYSQKVQLSGASFLVCILRGEFELPANPMHRHSGT